MVFASQMVSGPFLAKEHPCHCRLKWVKVQKSGFLFCVHMSNKSSQLCLYSPTSQSLLPRKASLVLKHTGKKKTIYVTDVISNSTIINARLSFTANLMDVTHIALIS